MRITRWFDGERSISVIIRRQPGANIPDVIDRVKTLLPELAKTIHPAIDIEDGVAVASIVLGLVLGLGLGYLFAGARISGRQTVSRCPGGARHQQARTTSGTRAGADNAAREAFRADRKR